MLFTSDKDDWETPQDLFNVLHEEFEFDLDAAANDRNAKCTRYFTKEQDALSQQWEGSVFCNPPYGREIPKFLDKAYTESKKDY